MHHRHPAILLCTCLLLAACGASDKTSARQSAGGEERLPSPDSASGSVTGMPDPGAPSSQPPQTPQIPAPAAGDGLDDPPATASDAPLLPQPDAANDVDAAVLVLRNYYAAINARDYAAAYAQWSDGGRASGQSPQQFADGYVETQGVSVALGEPGLVEGAAGSRYIEVPATLEATQADGGIRRYAGSFTLRRTEVDGASEAQRRWHIASASLREMGRPD